MGVSAWSIRAEASTNPWCRALPSSAFCLALKGHALSTEAHAQFRRMRLYIIHALRGQLLNASMEVSGGRKPNSFQPLENPVHKNGGVVRVATAHACGHCKMAALPATGWSISVLSKRRILPLK